MFSGIIEGTAPIIAIEQIRETLQIVVQRLPQFDDVAIGDSIACDGVCLTVERLDHLAFHFTLGAETLKATGWTAANLVNRKLNMERSLRLGDRIHGHWVSGHVDTMATVESIDKGESWIVRFRFPKLDRRHVWTKGSISFNGVGLTVNQISQDCVDVCLIPETLSRTNLSQLIEGDQVTVEYDHWAKAFVNYQENKEALP